MSVEDVKAFVARMKSDAEFRTKMDAAKDAKAAKALLKEVGLSFTKKEFDQVVGGLSDDDLAQVAGGMGACVGFCGLYRPRLPWEKQF